MILVTAPESMGLYALKRVRLVNTNPNDATNNNLASLKDILKGCFFALPIIKINPSDKHILQNAADISFAPKL